MKNMLIVISYGVPNGMQDTLLKHTKGRNPFAGLSFSKKIIDTMACGAYSETLFFTIPPIGSFPKNSDLFWVAKKRSLSAYPFCNILGLKNSSIIFHGKRAIRHQFAHLDIDHFERIDILAIEATLPIVSLSIYAKKLLKKAKLTLIVPDLPEYINSSKTTFIYKFAKRFDTRSIYKRVNKSVDGFVTLTESINSRINKTDVPHCVVEGVADDTRTANTSFVSGRFVYTGATDYEYSGLDFAIQAIREIQSDGVNATLVIAGSGKNEKELKKIDSKNGITYLGAVSPSQIVALQDSAECLICLRKENPKFAFSFPSKILDYLSTGKPVICSKILGIPDEYYKIVFSPKLQSVASVKESFLSIMKLTKSEKEGIATKSRQFLILKNKSNTYQKIKALIDSEYLTKK